MTDEVDRVVDAWQVVRPDLGVDSLHIWSRLDRLSGVLEIHRKRAFTDHQVESWEFDVLAALRRAGEPYELSPGQLLVETHVTSGTMTNRIDRLVARGAVTRETSTSDRRSVRVRLTPAGLRLVDGAFEALLQVEEELLSGWSAEERASLAGYLRRLLASSI